MTRAEINAQSAALVWGARALLAKAHELRPDHKFLILKDDMLTTDISSISAYVASQQAVITNLQTENAKLSANQRTDDDVAGIAAAASLAQQIAASQAPAQVATIAAAPHAG